MSGQVALEAEGISKRFGGVTVVDEVSLRVKQGDIYGFLGPNGAGKTTAIRMMLGLMRPTSGAVRLFGHDIRRDFRRAIRHVGAMVEGPAFYRHLSARRNLRLFGRLSGGIPETRIDEVLALVGLSRRGDDRVGAYSQGMRQRLGIALALLEGPSLLVLDEPTNGLDPQGMREIRHLIRRVRDEEGTTVFLSSHLLGELEQICDRVAILNRGRVLREGRLEEVVDHARDMARLEVAVEEDSRAMAFLEERFRLGAVLVRRGHLEFPRPAEDLALLNRALVENGFSVSSLSVRRRTLEECFVDLTGSSSEVL